MNGQNGDTPINGDRLDQLAKNTARSLQIDGTTGCGSVRRGVRRSLAQVRGCHRRTAEWAVGQGALPQACEWLLDNWYLAQREGMDAAEAFRVGRLPAVRREGSPPAVLELGRALVGAGAVTVERLAVFLAGVQQVRPLTEQELSLFVAAVKAALVERLAAVCGTLQPMLSAEVEDGEWSRLSETMEQIFTAMRTLGSANLGRLLEESSAVERQLRRDPSGDYPKMDDATRGRYRQEVCRQARRQGLMEEAVARRAVEEAEHSGGEARHVGWSLFRTPQRVRASSAAGVLYVGAVVLPTLFLVLLVGFLLRTPVVAPLLLLPVSDIVKNCVDFLVVRLVRPRSVPRMELKEGVPVEGKTLCVVVSLLTGAGSGDKLAALLERYRLANRNAGENLSFGILADLPDSGQPMGGADREHVEAARRAVEALNKTYGGGFFLFFRAPAFQPRDERYMGWERKRGALLELVRLLKGRRTGMQILVGSEKALQGLKYVITLDGDTSLNVGAATELIGAMLHPLNRPHIDPRRRVVTSGYGLLQPRVGVELSAANRSQFSRIFAGQGGVDPYGAASSDVYHDLFDQGSFTGKGIFDVDAFFTCLDGRFPENTILSHDLLEGSYLHAGLIGDVELTDGYPYKVSGYFCRLHRWVRGDWQLLPWLGRRVPDGEGERVLNPLPAMAKWKIFDNLRRSLSPVCTLLALLLGMCVSGEAFGFAAAVAVLSAASHLLLSGAELAFRGGVGLRARYHATIIVGFGGVILQTVVQLLLLPIHAWTCATAICAALWRSLITRRGMLDWVTAADAERRAGDGLWANYRAQWPSVAVGLAAVLFSRFPAGGAAGLVWMVSPLFAWAMSRPIQETAPIPAADRAFLLHEGGLIWRYFSDFLRAEDHWLPPDNWQEQPAVGLARRTSPTNIGMALLCVLAAVDLDFTTRDRAVRLLGHMLDTLDALPKWHGHLYNWYDTVTAAPLSPRYVSTVDSGNLCACLIALREGLYDWGEGALARRAEALSDAMDFTLLYDRERKLFYIGYDAEKETFTQGWYDLMASEARQTSYVAVARGEVEPRHWRRLGRMLVREDDYSGMASWTGTMFEYFMPNLLLPCEKNSLIYESLAFCIRVQRKNGGRKKTPWGISESGFYAFDPGMSYQYKAHGVQRLGLKRGLDADHVVAPYASFLALLLAPVSAAKNLRRLRDMGLEGKYGLYEAADFTPGRLTGNETWETVASYMAHHLGMSLVAIDNVLRGGVMQERFMRDCAMSAYRELLQEKVPVGAPVMRPTVREVPEKPKPYAAQGFRREGTNVDRLRPACHAVSNGSYAVLCTGGGAAVSSLGGTALTLGDLRRRWASAGVSWFLRTGDGALYPLTAAPFYEGDGVFSWAFTGSGAEWGVTQKHFTAKTTLRVIGRESGELREVELTWRGDEPLHGELICYLEPVLSPQRDYDAHPAFSKLSVESHALGDGVLFTRRPREAKKSTVALAVLWSASDAEFDTSREQALGRGGLRGLSHALKRPACGTLGAVLDPCLLARFPVRADQGETVRLRLALGAAESGEDACLAAQRLLRVRKIETGSRLDGLLRMQGLSHEDALGTFMLLERLLFPTRPLGGTGPVPSQEQLWPFGISGDIPIAVCRPEGDEEQKKALLLAEKHRLLTRCGFAFDLVFLLDDGGDYRRPARSALLRGLHERGMEGCLGGRGGIHLVEGAGERTVPILAAAAVTFTREMELPPQENGPTPTNVKEVGFTLKAGILEYFFAPDGTLVLPLKGTLPPVGWSHVLAGEEFGWLTDETGCGHLWRGNARENQLIPWRNDPLMVGGPERLLLQKDGMCCSVFAAPDGLDCTVTYGMGWARWEKAWCKTAVKLISFSPKNVPARVFLLELTGDTQGVQVLYTVEPLLASEPSAGRHVETVCKDNSLVIQNPWNRAFWPQSMLVKASAPLEHWSTEEDGVVKALWPAQARLVLVVGCVRSREEERAVLALAEETAAYAALEETRSYWKARAGALSVETGHEALDRYLNGWCAYQTIACRLFARTSRYQSGGAYGFRDQLQDVCGVLPLAPELARAQILSACAHQFEEGDVQHWWHETGEKGADRGVRTRISDDLLWLPYALCEYLEKTGDETILKEQVAYLSATPLALGEQERYENPDISQEMEDVKTHAIRAVRLVLERGTGAHGLLLMGAGDWNDGMNRVGADGKGESVWLTWFAAHVLERFAPLAGDLGETLRRAASELVGAGEAAWDGEWFLRGYYGDGAPLGSHNDRCCRIDSIAQSWAALAPGADQEKAKQAVNAALEQLSDREHRLVRLFTPAFDGEGRDPGYIRSYVPGVRENGGQYTHAAVWLALGCLRLGMAEQGWQVLNLLLPGGRDQSIYRVEPYVLAADVYDNPQHTGRGGWSWYTGAAGWYFRVATEELLGLRIRAGRLFVEPNLPQDWTGWSAVWRTETALFRITVRRGSEKKTLLDGQAVREGVELARYEGEHTIEVFF